MEVGAVELLLVLWFCVFEFVNILLNYRGSQAGMGDMMKQALRVAFGFLMLWAAVLHAEVRIEITRGWTRRDRLALCL